MASLEGNLCLTGIWMASGETGEPDLAEYHLDWWNGFNLFFNEDVYPVTMGVQVHYGGNYHMTAAYLTRGDGAVRDVDGQSFTVPPPRDSSSYHKYYARDIVWFNVGSNLENINRIKQQLMDHGIVCTCLCSDPSFLQNNIHYQPPNTFQEINHAVAIIGWDDSLVTQAPLPGAWLCKNSHGTNFGINGYFWVSFYDKYCGQDSIMGAVAFYNVERMPYDRIYYHDYHGWRDTKRDCREAFNAFQCREDLEELTAVSFFTAADSVDFSIKVYYRFDNNELCDSITSKYGMVETRGFHTIDLDYPVMLSRGDSFYVYLDLSHGGHPLDRTSSIQMMAGAHYRAIVESIAHPGESYFYDGTNWLDLFYYQFPYPMMNGTANFCIKALTKIPSNINTNQYLDHFSWKLEQNYPNPFNPTTTIEFSLPKKSNVTLEIFNVLGERVTTLLSASLLSGSYQYQWDASGQPGGIYFYRLVTKSPLSGESGEFVEVKKMILMK
jgi:hypothetical protein